MKGCDVMLMTILVLKRAEEEWKKMKKNGIGKKIVQNGREWK